MKTKKRLSIFLVIIFIVCGVVFATFFVLRSLKNEDKVIEDMKAKLPSSTIQANPSLASTVADSPIAKELNLSVPFTSQAPTGNWDHQHEENCEEASILMASRYFQNRTIKDSVDAERGMLELVNWENNNIGTSDSITAEQTAKVLMNFLNLNVKLVDNPTVDQIKNALADNQLVLVPAAGRLIGNPFYTSPGPLYHMLVIRGYTETQFITNDPGTKRGENYPYGFDVVLDANHDWNNGDPVNGLRQVIVVSK